MKHYAIENNGIVKTWDECKSIVHGTSLRYKSFAREEEAQAWLDKIEGKISKKRPKEVDDDTPIFYIDGSHIKGTPKMGFGIYTNFKDVEYSHYQAGSAQWIADFIGQSDNVKIFEKVSNCTMEVLAAVYLLDFLASAKGLQGVLIRYDYEGVGCWLRGFWKTREPYIEKIVTIGKDRLAKLAERGVKIEWEWVRGHSGHEGNDKVDSIAKGNLLSGSQPLSALNFLKKTEE